MNAAEVKAKLYGRHPASDADGMIGRWTCVEEFEQIDFLAISSWSDCARVGYEVKVSRGDMRSELLRPHKRERTFYLCTERWFAVPKGLLTDAEKSWQEPEWGEGDFQRRACPGVPGFGREHRYRHWRNDEEWATYRDYGGRCARQRGRKGTRVRMPVPSSDGRREEDVVCWRCGGKGYIERSIVERIAPTLWIPRDMGLVEVSERGCHVVKRAPVLHRRGQAPQMAPYTIGKLVRWASVRPDPRHARVRAVRASLEASA